MRRWESLGYQAAADKSLGAWERIAVFSTRRCVVHSLPEEDFLEAVGQRRSDLLEDPFDVVGAVLAGGALLGEADLRDEGITLPQDLDIADREHHDPTVSAFAPSDSPWSKTRWINLWSPPSRG